MIETLKIDPPRINDDEGTVEVPFMVAPALTTWDPTSDEAAAPEVIPELGYDTDLATPAAPSVAIVVDTPTGSELRVRGEETSGLTAEYAVTEYDADGLPSAPKPMTTVLDWAYLDGYATGDSVSVRQRYFNAQWESSAFSDYLTNASLTYNNTPPSALASFYLDTSNFSVSTWDVGVVVPGDIQIKTTRLYTRDKTLNSGNWGAWGLASEQFVRPNNVATVTLTRPAQNFERQYAIAFATSDGTESALSTPIEIQGSQPEGGA